MCLLLWACAAAFGILSRSVSFTSRSQAQGGLPCSGRARCASSFCDWYLYFVGLGLERMLFQPDRYLYSVLILDRTILIHICISHMPHPYMHTHKNARVCARISMNAYVSLSVCLSVSQSVSLSVGLTGCLQRTFVYVCTHTICVT